MLQPTVRFGPVGDPPTVARAGHSQFAWSLRLLCLFAAVHSRKRDAHAPALRRDFDSARPWPSIPRSQKPINRRGRIPVWVAGWGSSLDDSAQGPTIARLPIT